MEHIVIFGSKDYAQVVFDSVAEWYTELKPIECWFTLNQTYKAGPTDFIGIYKVGFTCLDSFVYRKPIQMELITKERKGKLVFEGEQLPKQDGEFYQFVYVSEGKLICGASIPFQFRRTTVLPRVPFHVNDEESILMRPKEIIETIEQLRAKCDKLALTNETYVKLLRENEQMINLMVDDVANMKLQGLKITTDKMIPLERELTQHQQQELAKFNSELKSKELLISELRKKIESIVAERNQLNTQIVSLKHENEELKSTKMQLTKDYTMTKEKFSVVEHSVETLKGQLVNMTKKLEEVSTVNKKNEELLVKMREQEKMHQQEKDHFVEIIKKMREQPKVELTGQYYALQVANNHLEKKFNLTSQESTEQRQRIQELFEEIELLKDRLRQGAYEYTCLSGKFNKLMCLIEGSKIESEIKREFNEIVAGVQEKMMFEQPELIKIPTTKYITLNEVPSWMKYEQLSVPSWYKEIPRSRSAQLQTIGTQKLWEPIKTTPSMHTESHIQSVHGQTKY